MKIVPIKENITLENIKKSNCWDVMTNRLTKE